MMQVNLSPRDRKALKVAGEILMLLSETQAKLGSRLVRPLMEPAPTRGKIRTRRFRGIGRAARKLGVTREHLYRVLSGKVVSTRISRWAAQNLTAGEPQETPR
jgi:hypothetical protein